MGDISLREALDRLAATARLRLSYSPELLDLNRLVCLSMDSVPVGAVLVRLLEGAPLEAVSAGADHVVLAPSRPSVAAAAPVRNPVVLERIVVTGSAMGAARKPLPVAMDVVDGEDIASRSDGALTSALNASVPGMWMWTQSPSSLLAQYGSIRGASSFGLSYPKVYIDGIQVANPLLLTRLTPEAIDHVEVIRGPQGAALYGADAISGVTNIVTRQEGVEAGEPKARLRTGFGLSSSDFASNPPLGQDHVLSLRTGSHTRSLGLNLEAGGSGAYIPGAYQRFFAVNGSGRSVGPQSILTGTVRVFGERAGTPVSPLLPAGLPNAPPGANDRPQSVLQYTAGTSFKLTDGDRLTHSIVAGVDGYALDGMRDDRGPIPSAADAALLAAQGNAARGTLRVSSIAHVVRSNPLVADLTLLGEQSLLHQSVTTLVYDGLRASSGPGPGFHSTRTEPVSQWRNNTGGSAQVNAGILDQVFLTGGVRFEKASGTDRVATLPMAGISWVLERGIASLKLRGAYGKGIRWPETAARETLWARTHPEIGDGSLAPEEQSGVEGGVDFLLARTFAIQVTRFDQVASGLIQRVMTGGTRSGSGYAGTYQMQNVGQISNRGWEIQGSLRGGPLSLTGTYSLARSQVRQLAPNYTGDLAVGDRMLDVPLRTYGVTATWSGTLWGGSVSGYRAEDWVSYDRIALSRDLVMGQPQSGGGPPPISGSMLRSYWINYPGVTHLRATVMHLIRRGLALSLTADNLLNRQRGEPDNLTVLPGRTISLGLRAEF